jgi:hypothetical protein
MRVLGFLVASLLGGAIGVDSRSFGNTFADFESPELRLRIAKNRGQVIAYVAPLEGSSFGEKNGDPWYPLEWVLWLVSPSLDLPIERPELEAQALDKKWDAVARLFAGGPASKTALDAAVPTFAQRDRELSYGWQTKSVFHKLSVTCSGFLRGSSPSAKHCSVGS